jgi:hypothetical protein
MQFTYPELLWALFLLLIPIFIHLFQLRRFKKTPFTNVRLLKKVVAKSRKSRSLKKWLLLFTRCMLIAAVVFAFAQPFSAGPDALRTRQLVIYLDNSFSMQAKEDGVSLLESAIQQLLRVVPPEQQFTLFTNDRIFEAVRTREIRNDLLSLTFSTSQLGREAIALKAARFFDEATPGIKDLIEISDFQVTGEGSIKNSPDGIQRHLVPFSSEETVNASIDSVFISERTPGTLELTALLSCNTNMEDLPVSLYNSDTLIAKTSAVWDGNMASVLFTLPSDSPVEGRIEIIDKGLDYDNQSYFTLGAREKIKVLAVGETTATFLERIYTEDDFEYKAMSLKDLNYSLVADQNLFILNELPAIPSAIQNSAVSFVNNGGTLVVIPSASAELQSYNNLLGTFARMQYGEKAMGTRSITGISFSHPLFEHVFEEEVSNFQYPVVDESFPLANTLPAVLMYQDGDPFLSGRPGVYVFSAPLSGGSSNFRQSPLVVPTFYNMGANSLKIPQLYYLTGLKAEIDVPIALEPDRILKVRRKQYEFIPKQQSFANRTALTFDDNPARDGNYAIMDDEETLRRVSFNYARDESELVYATPENLPADEMENSLPALFERFEKQGSIKAFWKWFVTLAVLCMLAELLIQKFLK